MIQRINYIKNMGIYRDFSWACEKNDDFKKVNILYGRNYSGKTTLSRVMRSLELRKNIKITRILSLNWIFHQGNAFLTAILNRMIVLFVYLILISLLKI